MKSSEWAQPDISLPSEIALHVFSYCLLQITWLSWPPFYTVYVYWPMSMLPKRSPKVMVVATAAHSNFEAFGKTSGPNCQIEQWLISYQFASHVILLWHAKSPPFAVQHIWATARSEPVHLGQMSSLDSWQRLSLCLRRPTHRLYLCNIWHRPEIQPFST